MRNDFTTIFGGVGRRRLVYINQQTKVARRFKMQKIRRAHQGWRNIKFGMINAIKVRRIYGRRPVISQFRR
jgi:hypothetical protein